MLNLQRSVGLAFFGLASLLTFGPSCSSDTSTTRPPQATGGTPSTGSGGSPSPTGGASPSTGGASGGTPTATGGAPTATGGAPITTGGTPSSGGSGGSAVTGGTAGSATGGTVTGGAVGSGGVAGSTGSGGAAGGSAGSGGGATGKGFLSEDFEAQTAGKQPTGWDNFVAWNKNGMNPSGDTSALVDETRAHSGTRSMRFKGGQNPAMITRTLPTGTTKLYVRAWFWMTRSLGQHPEANHETLIGIRGKTGAADNEIRFGEIKGVIGTNEVPTDNISPKMDQWGKGPLIPAMAWNCIEVAFIADQANNELHAWHNGTEVHSVTAGDQWQNGVMPMNWMNGKFLEVILGWHSFSSAANDVWMDDLVLSDSRIGCE